MPVELKAHQSPPPAEWHVTGRFVLITTVLFFLVVASVNGIMMTLAIKTFPGIDAKNGYEKSQNYNKEIAAARAQAERGWVSGFSTLPGTEATTMSFSLKDRDGAPVTGLGVEAQISHPTDKRRDHTFALREVRPGFYEGNEKGLTAGSWKVRIVATRGEEQMFVSDRSLVLR